MMFTSRIRPILAFGLLAVLTACASTNDLNVQMLNEAEINNFRTPESSVLSSGQPTVSQLGIAARAGVRHVINLRTEGEEVSFSESDVVDSLGMEYHSIPVAGGAGVTPENAATLAALLEQLDGQPVLIHCATGNRVGGLMALSARADGASINGALAEGARWGLTSERLQQIVRENMAE